MRGKVVLEEAYQLPSSASASFSSEEDGEVSTHDLAHQFVAPHDVARYLRQLASITGERLALSDAHGIGYTILSQTGPGCQGMADRARAEAHAAAVNDWIAARVRAHRDRLGCFAMLSMHDAAQAAAELRRCVTRYGFHGALLYNFQTACGPDGKGDAYLFYDGPEYDVFWQECVALDVPVYLHPTYPTADDMKTLYAGRKYLLGPPLSFANGVSIHLLGLITNGVFDRFPKLNVIVGHLGERIPFDFDRTGRWLENVMRPNAAQNGDVFMKHDLLYYFKNNIYLTTSGHFSTPTLRYVCDYLGPERLLFSVDYPYETIEEGCGWWDGDAENIKKALGGTKNYADVGRGNAKKLFRLEAFNDHDAPVV